MPILTEKIATLTARFDMLLTPEMKEYIKTKGGAAYLRNLVIRDIQQDIAMYRLQKKDGIENQVAEQAIASVPAETEKTDG